ncbi:MAG: glycosyltransferase [Clostridium sp.]|nr:glycosyltransferase [Clostridium sp.]
MDKLRICFFFHRFDGGGAEKMTVILANELARQGHEVSILIRHDKGPVKQMVSSKVHILNMGLPEKGKIRKNFGNICWLRKILRPGQFDVLLSVTAEMSQVAALTTYMLRRRIPLVSVVHSTLSQEVHSFQRVREWLFPLLNRRYDKVIAVSEAVRRDYIALCNASPEQVVTVYNPIISEQFWKFTEMEPQHPWLEEGRKFKVIVLAGRFCEAKNHTLMLDALRLLRAQGDYRLILLGDGELREQLVEKVKHSGIEEAVDFVGFVQNPAAYFSKADVVALSSRYEGLPSVLVEALAVGAKIVSTDCPSGPREILQEGKFGILVKPGNPDALAMGILCALTWNPDREALRQRALDFTDKQAIEGYLRVIHETITYQCERKNHAQKADTSLG